MHHIKRRTNRNRRYYYKHKKNENKNQGITHTSSYIPGISPDIHKILLFSLIYHIIPFIILILHSVSLFLSLLLLLLLLLVCFKNYILFYTIIINTIAVVHTTWESKTNFLLIFRCVFYTQLIIINYLPAITITIHCFYGITHSI